MSNIFGISESDLNGECFVAGAEGEREVLVDNYLVHFPAVYPAASDATVGTALAITNNQANLFVYVNAKELIEGGRPVDAAAKIAYLRMLAARLGLISPEFTTAAHNVRYNHAVRLSADRTKEFTDLFATADPHKGEIAAALSADVRKKLRLNFTDIVCCVAYVFRVRGHHFRDDFAARYTTLWSRCLHKPDDMPLEWVYAATDALHAIMPDVLDGFWIASANASRCAGALIKRLDSAPAGVAGVVALKRGLDDVRMLFPGVVNNVPDAYKEFNALVSTIQGSRWGGSVNCRFYGVQRIRVNEGTIGALASVVMGVYEQLAPESKLRESPALARLAQVAPATGGAIGIAARRATQDERLNLVGAMAANSAIEAAPE